jgi:chemotaxis protein methyltransferase CheR
VISESPVDQGDWARFSRNLLESTLLDISQYRPEQMQKRVSEVAAGAGTTIGGLADRIKASPHDAKIVLHLVSIHTTDLFRDPDRWLELQEKVVPELLEARPRIRAWSAGCANGAESYSLAAALTLMDVDCDILATDLDEIALGQAEFGIFPEIECTDVPATVRELFFEPCTEGIVARESLRSHIAFQQHNLLHEPPATDFDLICCRNVSIYLTDYAKETLFQRLLSALRPGGYLFLGATERIFSPRDVGFESEFPGFYRKPGQPG